MKIVTPGNQYIFLHVTPVEYSDSFFLNALITVITLCILGEYLQICNHESVLHFRKAPTPRFGLSGLHNIKFFEVEYFPILKITTTTPKKYIQSQSYVMKTPRCVQHLLTWGSIRKLLAVEAQFLEVGVIFGYECCQSSLVQQSEVQCSISWCNVWSVQISAMNGQCSAVQNTTVQCMDRGNTNQAASSSLQTTLHCTAVL